MKTYSKAEQKFISQVRKDSHMGIGTCSAVDECVTDREIVELYQEYGAEDAWEMLRTMHDRAEEQFVNAAWEVYEATGVADPIIATQVNISKGDDAENPEKPPIPKWIIEQVLFEYPKAVYEDILNAWDTEAEAFGFPEMPEDYRKYLEDYCPF